jgi:hypothetical protein
LLTAGLTAAAQPPQPPATPQPPVKEIHDAPVTAPRATPGDYQSHFQVGKFIIAVDFPGHTIPTPDQNFTSEDYIAFEIGIFGPPGSTLKLSGDDFSLKVNGKKPVPAQPCELVFHSLKDPDWEETVRVAKAESQSKTSIGGGGGGGGGNDPPPAPPKMPIGTERNMEMRVRKAALPEGDRPLPEAGLIFFTWHSKTSGIKSMELIYSGPAGKATMNLQP